MFLPSRSFSGWKRRCCFSAYFTPKPTLLPFVLACMRSRLGGGWKGGVGLGLRTKAPAPLCEPPHPLFPSFPHYKHPSPLPPPQ